jgi:hypothetical protein
MRRIDKRTNIEQANKRLEESYLTSKGLLKEFDYEKHKHNQIDIIERVRITINTGTPDVIEVEGVLGESKNKEMLWFKPTGEPKIFKSSNSTQLSKDEEISYQQANQNTRTSYDVLNNIGKWLGISSEGVRFYNEINFGKNINLNSSGLNYIGNMRCVIMNIQFDKI